MKTYVSVIFQNESTPTVYQYVPLIQEVNDMLLQDGNFCITHIHREVNICAYFSAKLGATSDLDLADFSSPSLGLSNLFYVDSLGT
jgi:hypothetical protein